MFLFNQDRNHMKLINDYQTYITIRLHLLYVHPSYMSLTSGRLPLLFTIVNSHWRKKESSSRDHPKNRTTYMWSSQETFYSPSCGWTWQHNAAPCEKRRTKTYPPCGQALGNILAHPPVVEHRDSPPLPWAGIGIRYIPSVGDHKEHSVDLL